MPAIPGRDMASRVQLDSRMARKIVTVLGAAAFAVAGCSSTVRGQPEGNVALTTSPAPVVASTTTTGAPVAQGDGGITPTGTTLSVGQTATVLYQTKDLSKETTRLAVTAVSVKKGSISDLKNFDLDAQTKVSQPFYVTMSFRNTGPSVMEPSGIFGLIKAMNTDGDELNSLSLIGSFKPCDGDVPKTLAVGAEYTDCRVYLAPAGQDIGKVVFGFYIELDRTEITWKAV